MASVAIRLSGASPRVAKAGWAIAAANEDNVSRCQPKAARFSWTTLRARSLAASSVAPTSNISSAGARASSHGSSQGASALVWPPGAGGRIRKITRDLGQARRRPTFATCRKMANPPGVNSSRFVQGDVEQEWHRSEGESHAKAICRQPIDDQPSRNPAPAEPAR